MPSCPTPCCKFLRPVGCARSHLLRGVGTGSPQAWTSGLGTGVGDEVSKPSSSRQRSDFKALLHRCEQQELLNQKHKKAQAPASTRRCRWQGERARRTAPAGAFWNATSGLVSSMMEMTDSRAGKLIPTSGLNSGIHVPLDEESKVCDRGTGFDILCLHPVVHVHLHRLPVSNVSNVLILFHQHDNDPSSDHFVQ